MQIKRKTNVGIMMVNNSATEVKLRLVGVGMSVEVAMPSKDEDDGRNPC